MWTIPFTVKHLPLEVCERLHVILEWWRSCRICMANVSDRISFITMISHDCLQWLMDLTTGNAFSVFLHLSLRVLEIYTESWNKSAHENLSYVFVTKCFIYFSYTASVKFCKIQLAHTHLDKRPTCLQRRNIENETRAAQSVYGLD